MQAAVLAKISSKENKVRREVLKQGEGDKEGKRQEGREGKGDRDRKTETDI